MNLFLDTNIIVDFILERQPFYPTAATILSFASDDMIAVSASSLTIVNARYICVERMKQSLDDFKCKFDELRQILNIVSVDSSDIFASYDSHWDDFEDGVQYFSAIRAGCDQMVTRNAGDFEKSDIPVASPIQICDQLYELRQKQNGLDGGQN